MTEMEKKDLLLEQKELFIAQLSTQISAQSAQIDDLTELVSKLNDTIAELQQTIKELREQLGQNSSNSSKPPSSDGYKKPNPKSLRTSSGLKPGGQKGHKGSNMVLPHEPDVTMVHTPQKCQTCPMLSECIANNVFKCAEKRYVVEAVVTTKITEHQSLEAFCPCGNTTLRGSFPDDVKAYLQYGDSVSVLVGLLNSYGAMSCERIHVLLGQLLGVSLSTGTICSMVNKCASVVKPAVEKIRDILRKENVVHFDETGIRVNGKLNWIHNSSTDKYTYQTIDPKRGKEGIDNNGVLPGFNGIAVHDCHSSYWKYKNIKHALCCAHLLRELISIIENEPEHLWAKAFRELLLSMKKARDKAVAEGRSSLELKDLHRFEREYDLIMALADKECPCPQRPPGKKRGRTRKGKERSLIERLIKHKASVCLFMYDFRVPFDNNQAERDLRVVKTKSKVSGGFRISDGAQNYLDIMSYLSTGMKHGVNVFDSLMAAFTGKSDIVIQGF